MCSNTTQITTWMKPTITDKMVDIADSKDCLKKGNISLHSAIDVTCITDCMVPVAMEIPWTLCSLCTKYGQMTHEQCPGSCQSYLFDASCLSCFQYHKKIVEVIISG